MVVGGEMVGSGRERNLVLSKRGGDFRSGRVFFWGGGGVIGYK